MADAISYRGFVIVAAPLPLAEGGWSHDGCVQENLIYDIDEDKFSAAIEYPTREEAIQAILAHGRQLVDAKFDEAT